MSIERYELALSRDELPELDPDSRQKVNTFLKVVAEYGSDKQAASACRLPLRVLRRWRDTYPIFAERWEQATQKAAGSYHKLVGDAAYGRGIFQENGPSVQAAIKMATVLNKELFGDRIEIGGTIFVSEVPNPLPPGQLPVLEATFKPIIEAVEEDERGASGT